MPTIFKPKRRYDREPAYQQRLARQQFYNTSAWQQLRLAHLMEHPLCEACLLEGKTTLAVDVHHLVSFTAYRGAERDAVATNPRNLVSLCKECHWRCHHGRLKGCKSLDEMAQRLDQERQQQPDADADDEPREYVF